MKFLKVLSIYFSAFFYVICSENFSNLAQSACKVVKSALEKDSWIKTIAVLEMRRSTQGYLINDLLHCMPINISITLMNTELSLNLNQERIHNPTFTVMLVDGILSHMDRV
jgi:hypothetical protein